MMKMMTKEGQYMARKLGFYDTVTELMESNSLRGLADMAGDYTGINRIEAYIRGVTAEAAKNMRMTELGFDTWAEAVAAGAHHRILFDAMRMAENTNHMYGPLARTPYINRILGQPAGSAMTQFTLYPLKQTEELVSLANQNPGKVVQYFAISGYMTRLFAQHVGYDVTQWTGVGYADDVLTGNVESPFTDFWKKWTDLSEEMNSGDARRVSAAAKMVESAAQSLIPVIARDLGKAGERLYTGKVIDSRGRMVREMYHGEHPNLVRRIAEGLDPGLYTDDPNPAFGGDLVPTLMMGPPIRDRVQRVTHKALKRQKSRDIVSMRGLLSDFVSGLESGDEAAAQRALGLLIERHGMRLSMDSMEDRIRSKMTARWISQNLRTLEENPQYRDMFLQIMQESGAGLGME
jgi:hypothetical protein